MKASEYEHDDFAEGEYDSDGGDAYDDRDGFDDAVVLSGQAEYDDDANEGEENLGPDLDLELEKYGTGVQAGQGADRTKEQHPGGSRSQVN